MKGKAITPSTPLEDAISALTQVNREDVEESVCPSSARRLLEQFDRIRPHLALKTKSGLGAPTANELRVMVGL